MGKEQTSPRGSVWAAVEDDPALSSAAKLAIATLQAAGKLPVGTNRIIDSGALQDPAAQTIAAGVGRFLRIEANQVIAGSGNFDEAVVKKLWSQIVTAKEGVFDKITANMLRGGALDGQLITGATIRTAGTGPRVVLDSNGIRLENSESGTDVFRVDNSGRVTVKGSVSSSDDWSWVRLNNWVIDGETADDTAGMGLAFNRSINPSRYSGGIYLQRNKGGDLVTVVKPPSDKTKQTGDMIIANDSLDWGGYWSSLHIGRNDLQLRTGLQSSKIVMADSGVRIEQQYLRTAVIMGGKPGAAFISVCPNYDVNMGLTIDSSFVRLTTLNGGKTSGHFFGDHNGAVMFSHENGNYAKITPSGFTSTGRTKKFSMHVPRVSEERGGEVLQHKCSESPYDGIEYWNSIQLGEDGTASWDLPDYVPVIASRRAPWVAIATADRGAVNASLGRGEDVYRVHLKGEPGAQVSVLVKGARIVEIEGASGGTSTWQDLGDESVWAPDPIRESAEYADLPAHKSGPIKW